MSEEFVPFGSGTYWTCLAFLLTGRGADLLSTWVATPTLLLEGNPIAKALGWRWGVLLNLLLCGLVAAWPLAALMAATTSGLVAARNFQSAWMMRSLGEEDYRAWYVERVRRAPVALSIACLLGQTVLVAGVGMTLVVVAGDQLVPGAVGLGILAYALAVLLYTGLSLWRIRRAAA